MNPNHAVILVAGEGRRLLPFTESSPKCFAEVQGETILGNALTRLSRSGVLSVTVVVGHLKDRVVARIGTRYEGMEISYVVNNDFKTTNSMYSLLLALRFLDKATWVLEGDVFFEDALLDLPVAGDFSWFGDSSVKNMDGAFLCPDASGRVTSLEIVRDINLLRSNHHKSVGMLRLSAEGVGALRGWLEQGVEDGKENLYYDLIVSEHLEDYPIQLIDVSGLKWFEIDSNADLEEARRIFPGSSASQCLQV